MNQIHHFITGNICPAARHLTEFNPTLFTVDSPKEIQKKLNVCYMTRNVCVIWTGVTLLFDLSDLPHGLLEDGTFVRLDVEAVDVGEVC